MNLHVRTSAAVRVTRGLAFGEAQIGARAAGGPRARTLRLDRYEPAEASPGARPALVLAFGGSFQRGSRADDVVEDGTSRNTAIAEYAERFAARGYVCFAIDYRLAPEDPVPGPQRWVSDPAALRLDRVNLVRGSMGLPACGANDLAAAMDAAFDDVACALDWVCANADAMGVDPGRVAVGGHSAGAIAALAAAYVLRRPVAAVVSLSGAMGAAEIARLAQADGALRPALLVRGEHDLPEIDAPSRALAARLAELGTTHEYRVVPGAGHFYPRDALTVAAPDGPVLPLEDAMAGFLERHLGRPR